MKAEDLVQLFPRQEDGRVVHREWRVDLLSAQRCSGSSGLTLARLEHEVREMGKHFPRWILTVQAGRRVGLCASCRGILVFDRGLRCVSCDTSPPKLPSGARLAWFGLMPPIGIEGLGSLRDGLLARPPAGHVVGRREGIGPYLLVPLLVTHPADFPREAFEVHYMHGILDLPGMPGEVAGHAHHMYPDGRMCLFAPGQWQEGSTCREVLQQRAYAHVIKLLNYAGGKRDSFASVT